MKWHKIEGYETTKNYYGNKASGVDLPNEGSYIILYVDDTFSDLDRYLVGHFHLLGSIPAVTDKGLRDLKYSEATFEIRNGMMWAEIEELPSTSRNSHLAIAYIGSDYSEDCVRIELAKDFDDLKEKVFNAVVEGKDTQTIKTFYLRDGVPKCNVNREYVLAHPIRNVVSH